MTGRSTLVCGLLLAVVGCAEGAASPQAAAPFGQATAPNGERGLASYYADRFVGRRTSSGEPYDPFDFTAAHRSLPFGSLVDVRRDDGRHVVVKVNDRGPYGHSTRIIDLSRAAAEALGMIHDGIVPVVIRVVSLPPR